MPSANAIKEDLIQSQILQAAHQLFQKHGFQKVSMDDVAKAIGKGRSSLYYYYKSKDEVFDAVIDAEIKEILNEIGRAMEKVPTTEEKIRAYCTAKIRIARKRRSFLQAVEAGMNADEMSQYVQKKMGIHKRMIGEETALLRQVLAVAPSSQKLDTVIFVLLSSLRGLKEQLFVTNDFSHVDAAIDTLTRMTVQELKK